MPVRGNLVAGLSAADSNCAVLGGKFDRRACGARPGAAGGSVLLALDVRAFTAAPARLAASETRLAGAARELGDRRAARRARDRVAQHPALYRTAKNSLAQFDADPVGAAGARACRRGGRDGRPDESTADRG